MTHRNKDTHDVAQELQDADQVLDKADALLRRHLSEAARRPPPDAIEIPLLTDVIEEKNKAATPSSVTRPAAAKAPTKPQTINISPRPPAAAPKKEPKTAATGQTPLNKLEAQIMREMEAWFAKEMPQIVQREIDRLSHRLRDEITAQVKLALAPALSQQIAERLRELMRSSR